MRVIFYNSDYYCSILQIVQRYPVTLPRSRIITEKSGKASASKNNSVSKGHGTSRS